MKKLFYLSLCLFISGFFPSTSFAQTTTTDLEVTGIEFNPITGTPSNVIVSNVGTTTFSGQIRSFVTFLDGADKSLPQSQGYLDYGRGTYPDALIDGVVPQRNILPGEQHRIIMTEIPHHRHRGAIKAKAEIVINDGSLANNKKTFSAPMPDLLTRILSVTKDATSDRQNNDRYTLNYAIVNDGAVGYIGASSLMEPIYDIKVGYQAGRSTTVGNDISYQIMSSIPAGGTLAKSRSIYVDKQDSPVSITITVDKENRLAESNETNNITTQAFTRTDVNAPTPSPTPAVQTSATPGASPSPLLATEVSTITAVPVKTTVSTGGATLLGISVKPCTALATVKDVKDNLVTALTFNKSKKVENKLKQAATRANAAQTSTDPACITKQLTGLQNSQASATALITKLETSAPKKAEPLALFAIQTSVSQAKAITYQAATATVTPTAAVKTQIAATEAAIISRVTENAKAIPDAAKLNSTIGEVLKSNDSAHMAVINIELAKKLEPIKAVTETVKQAKQENVEVVKTVIASKDSNKSKELKEFLNKVTEITDQKTEADTKAIELEDFVKSTEKDETPSPTPEPTPTPTPSPTPTPKPTPTTKPKVSDNPGKSEGENVTPNPEGDSTPKTNIEDLPGY